MYIGKIFRLLEDIEGYESVGFVRNAWVVVGVEPFVHVRTTYVQVYLLFNSNPNGSIGTVRNPLPIEFNKLVIPKINISLNDIHSGRITQSARNITLFVVTNEIQPSSENRQTHDAMLDLIRNDYSDAILNSGFYALSNEQRGVAARSAALRTALNSPRTYGSYGVTGMLTRPYDYGGGGDPIQKYYKKEEPKKSTCKFEKVFTYDELKALFEYIPMVYDNISGFFNPKNNTFMGKTKFNLRGIEKSTIYSKVFIEDITMLSDYIARRFSFDVLRELCTFKIKSYQESSDLFSFGKIKKESIGKTVEITKTEFNATVKKSDKVEQTVYVKIGNSSYRFVLSDIEIIYPNVGGWNLPKDRVINKNSKVRVINNKHMPGIKRNDVLVVKEIKILNKNKYVGIENNGKLVFEKVNKFKTI